MKSIRYFSLPKISNLICQAALFAYRCYGNRDDRHGQNTERLTVLLLTLLWLFVLFASFRFFVFFFFFVIFLFFAKETFSLLFSISRSIGICFAYDATFTDFANIARYLWLSSESLCYLSQWPNGYYEF